MAAAFSKKPTAMLFQMPHKVAALHAWPESGRQTQPLPNDLPGAELLFGQGLICCQDHSDCLPQILARLIQRFALCIRSW